MRNIAIATALATMCAAAGPAPRQALLERLEKGPEIIGIVHWGLNTYTGREWGYGDTAPELLAPAAFDAGQIAAAAKAGGLGGLVIVAKHHDGFCLWPTRTTGYNISASPFRGGGGDYLREMADACRAAGLKFGIYVSPWDRHDAAYASAAYVDKYHAQLRELLDGSYGEVFEVWFDGANGGDGYYGGTRETRTIPPGYYRFDEVSRMVRTLQPGATMFGGGDADFRWPGNERGILHPDSRATCDDTGALKGEAMREALNLGAAEGPFFRVCEADFPLRKGWFWRESENGTAKSAAYLAKLYLSSVGNGGTMNIGLSPNRDGLLEAADVRSLAGFDAMRRALFEREAAPGGPFNVLVMKEDLSHGEKVQSWRFIADGEAVFSGKSIGRKRIRVLEKPVAARHCRLEAADGAGTPATADFKLYLADEELVRTILSATDSSGETDTERWMRKN